MKRTAEIRTLRSFVIVAREGNISRAAEVLNLTQPAISLQLKRLAEDTGLTLFRRTSKGMELTRDGAAVLAKAEKVFTALSEFGDTARRISGHVRGKLRIGTIVDPGFIRLGQLLARLVEDYPDLRTELAHGISGEVIARLLRDQIDAGYFLGDLESYRDSVGGDQFIESNLFHQRILTRITYRVIAPAGWEKRVIGKDWADLADLPWIGTPPKSVHSRLLDRIFSENRCEQRQVALVDQENSMLAMVQSGVGLSLCHEATALEKRQSEGLVVADRVRVETPLSFVALQARRKDPSVNAVFDVLGEVWSN
jgi:DNA-binding transcriptional LysR family regulator